MKYYRHKTGWMDDTDYVIVSTDKRSLTCVSITGESQCFNIFDYDIDDFIRIRTGIWVEFEPFELWAANIRENAGIVD